MKLYLAIFAVLLVSVAALFDDKTYMYNELRQKASVCCEKGCNTQELEDLRQSANFYVQRVGESNVEEMDFINKVIEGARCVASENKVTKSNVARSDGLWVSCSSYGPYDVSLTQVKFTCTITASIAAGIRQYSLYSYMNAADYTWSYYPQPVGGCSYSDSYSSNHLVTSTCNFTLPRYAPAGNYTLNAYAYGSDSNTYYSSVQYFGVLSTTNDNGPPVLTAWFAPAFARVTDKSFGITLRVVDDLTGVQQFQIYADHSESSRSLGYSSYWTQSPLLSLTTTANFTIYSNSEVGLYEYQVYVYDAMGLGRYYSFQQLITLAFQSNVTLVANDCPAGKYEPKNTTGCMNCPIGTYSPAGSYRCTPCPTGTQQPLAGQGQCTKCPAGWFGPGGAAKCAKCPVGHYSYFEGTAVCTPCRAGTNTTKLGSTQCGYCPQGTFSCGGTASCTKCPVGHYSYGGLSKCIKCDAGKYAPVMGTPYCQTCEVGKFSLNGASTCATCPIGTTTRTTGANSNLHCVAPSAL